MKGYCIPETAIHAQNFQRLKILIQGFVSTDDRWSIKTMQKNLISKVHELWL